MRTTNPGAPHDAFSAGTTPPTTGMTATDAPHPTAPPEQPGGVPGPVVRRRRISRWLAYAVLSAAATGLLMVIAGFFLLDRLELGPLAGRIASARFGRTVSITSLHVAPGRWLNLDLRGVRIANIPGGTRPDMVELQQLTAHVATLSLLFGPVDVRRLEIEGLSVLLERTADGTRNWRGGDAPVPANSGADRPQVPTVLDARIRRSEITIRTSSGARLLARVEDGTLHADGVDAPMRLTATGAYQDTPVALDATLQSLTALREAAIPYGVDLRFASGDTTLRFAGTMTKPLDVDGAQGTLTLHAPTLQAILAMAGATRPLAVSADFTATLARSGDQWVLTDLTGKLGDSTLTPSTLRLSEGGPGQPDDMTLALAFDRLNLDPLLASTGSGSPFAVDHAPDPQLDVRLTAKQVSYAHYQATDATLAGVIVPDRIKLDTLALNTLGGRLQAAGQADSVETGGRVTAEASAAGLDVQRLLRELGAAGSPITGRLDAQAVVASTGESLEAARHAAHVSAVVWMPVGSISRDLVEKASVDIRRLFRTPGGMIPVSCLLAVIEMQAGTGTVSPVRIRTGRGTIAGQGRFDLNRRQIDLTLGSQSATTSDFALDIPFRIVGPFNDPDIRPSSGKATLATTDVNALPPALRQVAQRNPCLSAR